MSSASNKIDLVAAGKRLLQKSLETIDFQKDNFGGDIEAQHVAVQLPVLGLHHRFKHGLVHLSRGHQRGAVGQGDLVGVVGGLAVAACLANAGQYLTGHPLGELARLWLAAAQHQGVEAGFVDHAYVLRAA